MGTYDSDADGEGVQRHAFQGCAMLIEMKDAGFLSVKQVCVIVWEFAGAGVGECRKYALADGARSSHYARKIDSALGRDGELDRVYPLAVPGHSKRNTRSTLHSLDTLPAHEQITDHVSDPLMRAKFAELNADGDPPVHSCGPR